MKNIIYIVAAIVFSNMFASCTKIIDANLEESPALLVIEAQVSDSAKPSVRLTRLIDVEKNNDFPAVTGAVITITDDAGNTTTLQQSSQGTYFGDTVIGVPGRTYNLRVELNGQTYTATSTMPKKIYMDSLSTREFSFGEKVVFAALNYTDPVGQGNNYRAVLWHNDTLRTDIFIEDDKYSDGNNREVALFSQDYQLKTGDRFVIELQCIDRAVYDYFSILAEVDGSSGLASPANPNANISGGALGYFSAHTSHILDMVVE